MAKRSLSELASLPEYQQLIQQRKKIVWPLLLLTLIGYFSFILTIAFNPAALSNTNPSQSIISPGIWTGLGVIFLTFLVTGLYVYLANHRLEPLIKSLQEKAQK